MLLALAAAASWARQAELRQIRDQVRQRQEARRKGSHQARLQYPHVDLGQCIGCGTCVAACPEEGVIGIVHGQAQVIHGARCVGHGRCAEECPVGAIAVRLGDLKDRKDIPVLQADLQAPAVPGLYLAGEVTGFALVRTAVQHGISVARGVASRQSEAGSREVEWDLFVVGAGPAGLACTLEAKRLGLRCLTVDQEGLGGTVARYPRRKLVMTQPMELPLWGKLKKNSYEKEELIHIWRQIVDREALGIRYGECFRGAEPDGDGWRVSTDRGVYSTANLCLALGRRGSPRKLGVKGEELHKVHYSLMDARGYGGRRLCVVGGGDSAVEAALGLSEQPGSQVTLSYRKEDFFRLKPRNEARIRQAYASGKVEVLFQSQVLEIEKDRVRFELRQDGNGSVVERPNDEVFIMIGGEPPFQLLEKCGVSFDYEHDDAREPEVDQERGLRWGLLLALVLALSSLGWLFWQFDYYSLPAAERFSHPQHGLLRPSRGFGLIAGVIAAVCILANLSYLARRARSFSFLPGSLRAWMSMHVISGIAALIFGILHGALSQNNGIGSHALTCLVVLAATGSIGRYFYSFIPRAANGGELKLAEVQQQLDRLSRQWDRSHQAVGNELRQRVQELAEQERWKSGLFRKFLAVTLQRRRLARVIRQLSIRAKEEGISGEHLVALTALARQAYRLTLSILFYEELRGLLATWRFFHRWVALFMALILILHVVTAIRYAGILPGETP